MKFYHLLNLVDEKDVTKKIQELYDVGNDPESYLYVIDQFKSKKPSGNNHGITINIQYCDDPKYLVLEENPYYDMYGSCVTDGECYALDCTAWADILSMNVSEESLNKFDYVTIVAVALWELTFHGYGEETIKGFF